MDKIHSKWHKPRCCSRKKSNLARLKAKARWEKKQATAVLSDCTTETEVILDASDSVLDVPTIETPTNHNLETPTNNVKLTRSEKKISCDFSNNEATQGAAYSIMHDSMWCELLKNQACQECGEKKLTVKRLGEYGYSAKLQLTCMSCSNVSGSSFSSPRLHDSKKFEINKNVVEAFLCMGKGHAAMETFSMILGVPVMDRKTFDKYLRQLAEEGRKMKESVLQAAQIKVRQELADTSDSNIIDIGVSYDGSWQKRGHTSLYAIGCVIDIITGLVIDFEVISKYCHDCVKTAADLGKDSAEYACWFEAHQNSGSCEKNFEGSSGAMEVHAAEIMWKRSIEQGNMRYTVMLSDGDAKTFNHLSKLKIYGNDATISKEECINHASKRLGTALRNKVKEWKTKGICLGGKKKGNLTEETILKLQNYYRKSIKDNAPDKEKMKTAIFAALYHSMSTDKKPKHKNCPTGQQSWCFYNRALALGEAVPSHTTMKTRLSEEVVSKIVPVYQRLASDELLDRCLSGKTQNSNESVHSLIWKYCPKSTFVSKKRLELAATYAISQFNNGFTESLTYKENKTIRSPSLSIAQKKDKQRVKQSVYRDTPKYKTALKSRKFAKSKKEQKQLKKEGVSYAPGLF